MEQISTETNLANKYRQVTWNFPQAMYDRLEKAKAEGQRLSDIPPDVSDSSFAMFMLDRMLSIYEQYLHEKETKDNLVVDPFAGGSYKGGRTPRR